MNKISLDLPDKVFGIDTSNIVSFVPLIAVIVVVFLSVNAVFMPKYDELRAMQESILSTQAQTQKIVDKTRYLQSIDPSELQKNAGYLSSALLPQKNAYVLVDIVRRVITKFNFQVDSFLINPGKIDNKSTKVASTAGVSKIPIKISITGPKSSYLELVKSMEHTLPLLSINNFKMTTVGSMVKLELEISAFYLEDSSLLDINKLTLADLTLKKEETDLITNISSFDILEKGESESSVTPAEFKKYDRKDPFQKL